jgi:prophage regulatory protein
MARPEVTGRKTGRRLLTYQDLRARGIPWSRVHIARLEAARKFPLHIDVGDNSIAWFEDEIDDFLEMKAVERDAKARAFASFEGGPDGCINRGAQAGSDAGAGARAGNEERVRNQRRLQSSQRQVSRCLRDYLHRPKQLKED